MTKTYRCLIGLTVIVSLMITACSQEPAEIHYGSDECAYCKMMLSDDRFAAQMVTEKSKAIKFDAIECMAAFVNENDFENAKLWVSHFNQPGKWLAAEEAHVVKSEIIKSPMGESLLALATAGEVSSHLKQYPGRELSWAEVLNL